MINFLKKHSSKTAKIVGVVLFTLLMFVNLQIITNPNKNGDIDLFGIKLNMSTPTANAAADSGTCCPEIGSICVIGNLVFHGYYYKSSGPCGGD